ncbi:MAG TPA: nickel pincer cofactor biosynthesis protein LarC [Candidatus Dormibacteraeota bacterium]|nr:nickel pincer cofactor biosynthesis protein LarC [Candidatus Dormibacteraeota bacterium]
MIAYFDCFSGISGDMTLGALVDAGASVDELVAVVAALGLQSEVDIEIRHEQRGHLGGTRVLIQVREGRARTLPQLIDLVKGAELPDSVASSSIRALSAIGKAESAIHGVAPADVHLHELSGCDTIVDLVGAFSLMHSLGVTSVHASPLPAPRGWHGDLPLPAPAALRLMALAGAAVEPATGDLELVTPTGAAFLLAADAVFTRPTLKLERVGYGIGSRNQPGNALAVWLGSDLAQPVGSDVTVLETNLDDMAPTMLAALCEDLMKAGALDVSVVAALMKKGRPGHTLTILAEPDDADRLGRLLLLSSSTLGVRVSHRVRMVAGRRFITVQTPWGGASVKLKEMDGQVVDLAAEYEDCRRLAIEHGVGLKKVIRVVEEIGWRQVNES